MTFKSITANQHAAFISALAAGQYNLLLGAGASMDSHNRFGRLSGGEDLKARLCALKGADEKYSLQLVFSLLDEEEIKDHVTARFSNCTPGETPKTMAKFLWKRIFSWNIDDVIENFYKDKNNNPKQDLDSIHYNDEFKEASSIADLMLIHLHGSVLTPEKGYVFSREHYVKQVQTINPWMSVLTTFMRSEPMVISGTTLDESDLDYYLSFRTASTQRQDRGPSILVTKDDDAIIANLCKRHELIHFVGWSLDFFKYCESVLPNPPIPEDLIPRETRNLLPDGISRTAKMSFNSDFDLVPSAAKMAENSRFQFGHAPTWQDLATDLDIARPIVASLLVKIDEMLSDTTSPAELLLLVESPGTGKTTVLRRTAFELSRLGVHTFWCSALSRFDRATSDIIDQIDGRVVIVVDNLADQANAVSDLLDQLQKRDVLVLASERNYRFNYLVTAFAKNPPVLMNRLPLSESEAERLIEKYFENGNLGNRKAITHKTSFARLIVTDPIAVGCCRILNSFKPLQRIIDGIIKDAEKLDKDRYLCVSLALHCFKGGVRYEILTGVSNATGIVRQFNSNSALPIAYYDSDCNYVVPENATIASQVLQHIAAYEKGSLLECFTRLAIELRPFVNRQTIKRRTPEARLAGRLFDYDDVAGKLLGLDVEKFYSSVQKVWQWNSRYWEQVALLNLDKFQLEADSAAAQVYLENAVQHARNAVAIENHPFGLTTLGKILMIQMLVEGYSMSATFSEGFDCLLRAIDLESNWARRSIQPYTALLKGTQTYLEHGGSLVFGQRSILSKQLESAESTFYRDVEVTRLVEVVRNLTGL